MPRDFLANPWGWLTKYITITCLYLTFTPGTEAQIQIIGTGESYYPGGFLSGPTGILGPGFRGVRPSALDGARSYFYNGSRQYTEALLECFPGRSFDPRQPPSPELVERDIRPCLSRRARELASAAATRQRYEQRLYEFMRRAVADPRLARGRSLEDLRSEVRRTCPNLYWNRMTAPLAAGEDANARADQWYDEGRHCLKMVTCVGAQAYQEGSAGCPHEALIDSMLTSVDGNAGYIMQGLHVSHALEHPTVASGTGRLAADEAGSAGDSATTKSPRTRHQATVGQRDGTPARLARVRPQAQGDADQARAALSTQAGLADSPLMSPPFRGCPADITIDPNAPVGICLSGGQETQPFTSLDEMQNVLTTKVYRDFAGFVMDQIWRQYAAQFLLDPAHAPGSCGVPQGQEAAATARRRFPTMHESIGGRLAADFSLTSSRSQFAVSDLQSCFGAIESSPGRTAMGDLVESATRLRCSHRTGATVRRSEVLCDRDPDSPDELAAHSREWRTQRNRILRRQALAMAGVERSMRELTEGRGRIGEVRVTCQSYTRRPGDCGRFFEHAEGCYRNGVALDRCLAGIVANGRSPRELELAFVSWMSLKQQRDAILSQHPELAAPITSAGPGERNPRERPMWEVLAQVEEARVAGRSCAPGRGATAGADCEARTTDIVDTAVAQNRRRQLDVIRLACQDPDQFAMRLINDYPDLFRAFIQIRGQDSDAGILACHARAYARAHIAREREIDAWINAAPIVLGLTAAGAAIVASGGTATPAVAAAGGSLLAGSASTAAGLIAVGAELVSVGTALRNVQQSAQELRYRSGLQSSCIANADEVAQAQSDLTTASVWAGVALGIAPLAVPSALQGGLINAVRAGGGRVVPHVAPEMGEALLHAHQTSPQLYRSLLADAAAEARVEVQLLDEAVHGVSSGTVGRRAWGSLAREEMEAMDEEARVVATTAEEARGRPQSTQTTAPSRVDRPAQLTQGDGPYRQTSKVDSTIEEAKTPIVGPRARRLAAAAEEAKTPIVGPRARRLAAATEEAKTPIVGARARRLARTESTADSAAPVARAETVTGQAKAPIRPRRDLYESGSVVPDTSPPPVPTEYSLGSYRTTEVATEVSRRMRQIDDIRVRIPEAKNVRARAEALARELSEREGRTYMVEFAGDGATSEVYYLVEAGQPRTAAREVIKVRLELISHSSAESHAHAALMQDMYNYQLARELAPLARFDGEPLVEVARVLSSREELARGIIRQEAVHGPSVERLATALQIVEDPSRVVASRGMTLQEAQELIQSSGIPPDEMRRRIRSLEQFYSDVHDDVTRIRSESPYERLHYRNTRTTHLSPEARKQLTPEELDELQEPVGFDYNHGRNVIWRPPSEGRPGRFVIIDF